MLSKRLPLQAIFLALFLALFLAACGSTSETTVPLTETSTPSPASPASTPSPNHDKAPGASSAPRTDPAAEPAPDFSMPNLLDKGKVVRLSDYRGHIVFLNFWASWCPPCRAEMPDFETVFEEYDGEIIVLGVGIQDDPKKLLAFAQSIGITYPIVSDSAGEIARHYHVRSLPTTYLINSRGEVDSVAVGGVDRAALEKVIQRLQSESNP